MAGKFPALVTEGEKVNQFLQEQLPDFYPVVLTEKPMREALIKAHSRSHIQHNRADWVGKRVKG